MRYQTALDFYGTNAAIAKAADVTEQAVTRWAATGVVPVKRAMFLEHREAGKIKVDQSVYVASAAGQGVGIGAALSG